MQSANTNRDWTPFSWPEAGQEDTSACQPRPASCPWGCQGEPATVTGEEGTEPRLGCHHLRPNLPRAVALPGTCAGWWVAPPPHPGCYRVRTRSLVWDREALGHLPFPTPAACTGHGTHRCWGSPGPPEQWAQCGEPGLRVPGLTLNRGMVYSLQCLASVYTHAASYKQRWGAGKV